MFDAKAHLGRTLGGQYRLDALLGQGGFGAVFRAVDLNLNRTVAVKVIAHSNRPDLARRFKREAQVQALLRHPAIVRLLEYDLHGDMPFMVQEFVEGRTLSQIVKEEGPLSPERAVGIFSQLLDALDEAHANGVAHRDLKPANIMVVQGRRGEEVRLLDFGIAKLLREADDGYDNLTHDQLTATGQLLGTPAFLAPEQLTTAPVTHKTDLYALGCVMYWAVTGRRPFEGSLTQVLGAHVSTPPPPLPPSLPPAILGTVQRAMSKHPDDRFASAQEMERALTGQIPVSLLPTGMRRDTVKTGSEHSMNTAWMQGGGRAPDENSLGPMSNVPRQEDRQPRWLLLGVVFGVGVGLVVLLAFLLLSGSEDAGGGTTEGGDASETVVIGSPGLPEGGAVPVVDAGPDARPDIMVIEPVAVDAGAPPPPDADVEAEAAAAAEQAKQARIRKARAQLDRDLSRCRCTSASRHVRALRSLGVNRSAAWAKACQKASDGPIGSCGARLERRLQQAMSTCPCHGDSTRRLVDQLQSDFGVDKRRAWARRCTTPGLPGSCM